MKTRAYQLCALLAVAIMLFVLLRFGLSLGTLLLALLLAACPWGVIWLSYRLTRQAESEIDAAIATKKQNEQNSQHSKGV
ncbi:Ca2+/Na+ antiporter [Vogesella perlucida]|jgi:Ca2+/Na+ antiporter|nr:Ca2+/Na+ antiporter [Vogesella perlucida]